MKYLTRAALAGFVVALLVSGCTSHGQSAQSTSSSGQSADSQSAIPTGLYECATLSDGELQAAASENFTIVDANNYTDAGGNQGTYALEGDTISFQGAALDGQRAKYTAGVVGSNNPPSIALLMSDGSLGDTCQPH